MVHEEYEKLHLDAFNGDSYMAKEFLKLKNKYGIINAVETGSCIFSTSKWLGQNFENVYTFEHNKGFYDENIYKVSDLPNVKAYNMKSVEGIKSIINELNGPTIFYLDAHWFDECPINEEIDAISELNYPHVIVIHDFKTNNPQMGFDKFSFNGGFDLDLNLIYSNLEKIYPEGIKFYYNKEAEAHMRGVIYILPY